VQAPPKRPVQLPDWARAFPGAALGGDAGGAYPIVYVSASAAAAANAGPSGGGARRTEDRGAAGKLGAEYARRYNGDLYALNRARGIAVHVVSSEQLLAMCGHAVLGCCGQLDDGSTGIFIDAWLSRADFIDTLAHETAHALNGSWTEEECDAWAESFLAVATSRAAA
jgi:hypothetical protein